MRGLLNHLFNNERKILPDETSIYIGYSNPDDIRKDILPSLSNINIVKNELEKLRNNDLSAYYQFLLKAQITYFSDQLKQDDIIENTSDFAKIIFYIYENSKTELWNRFIELLTRLTDKLIKQILEKELLRFDKRNIERVSTLITQLSLKLHRPYANPMLFDQKDVERYSTLFLKHVIESKMNYLTIENAFSACISDINRASSGIKLLKESHKPFREYIQTNSPGFFYYLIRLVGFKEDNKAVISTFFGRAFDSKEEIQTFFEKNAPENEWGKMAKEYLPKYLAVYNDDTQNMSFIIEKEHANYIRKNRPEFGVN